MVAKRRKILIFPSVPGDKDFLNWLGSRLSMAGYDVWTEGRNLLGGEFAAENINKVISEEAGTCLVITNSDTKNNRKLMDLIQAAINIEEKEKLEGFVTPILYTDFDYQSDSPLQINRKQFIDMKNWGAGLAAVIRKLEKQQIPREDRPSKSLLAWVDSQTRRHKVVKPQPEMLQSNWYALSLPANIHFYEVTGISNKDELPTLTSRLSIPTREHLRLLCGFADSEEYDAALPAIYSVTHKYQVPVEDFLYSKFANITCEHQDAKRILVSLVSKGWNNFAKDKGLVPFEQADGQIVWWFPKSLVGDNYISFEKIDKSKGRRQLTGKYQQFCWHFGLKGIPVLDEPRRLVFSPHVIFTTDGETTVDKQYMHSKRRSACKSWRNDKWRELFLAAMAYLCGEGAILEIPLAANSSAEVSKLPIYLESAVSIDIDALQSDPNTDVEINFDDEIEESTGDETVRQETA